MVYVFQSCAPVDALNATTLPRKEQHGYFGDAAITSSNEETPAYNTPL